MREESKQKIKEKDIKDKDSYKKYLEIVESSDYTNTNILLKNGSYIDIRKPIPALKNELSAVCDSEELEQIINKAKKWKSLNVLSVNMLEKAKGGKKDNTFKQKKINENRNSKVGYEPMISYEKQVLVIELASKFFTVDETMSILVEELGYTDVGKNDVIGVRENNIDAIRKKQEEYRTDISSVRLGYKRSRLEEISELYARAKRNFFSTNKSEDGRFCKELLEAVRKEIEGDKIIVDGGIAIEVNHHVEEYIKKELVHQAPLREIILARVCKATKIPFARLIFELNRSPYSSEMGLVKPITDEKFGGYVSESSYDFDEIQKNRIEIDKENKLFVEKVIENDQQDGSVSVKDKINKLIAAKKLAAESLKIELEKYGK